MSTWQAELSETRAELATARSESAARAASLEDAERRVEEGSAREVEGAQALASTRTSLSKWVARAMLLRAELVSADASLCEAHERERGLRGQVRSLEERQVSLSTELQLRVEAEAATGNALAATQDDLGETRRREAELVQTVADLRVKLAEVEQAELEKRDAIAALVLGEVTATRREAAASPLKGERAEQGSLGEDIEERWLAQEIRQEANAEKAEAEKKLSELTALLEAARAEVARLTRELDASMSREARLGRDLAEAKQAEAEASAARAEAKSEVAHAKEGAAQVVAEMEERAAQREEEAAGARSSAAKKEAEAEEGIAAAVRAAKHVQDIEARLENAHKKFQVRSFTTASPHLCSPLS